MKKKGNQSILCAIFLMNIILMISLVESQQPVNLTESTLSAEAKCLTSSANLLMINGTKFNDSNSNGIWDDGEEGLADTTIRLMQNGTEISNEVTDDYGHYVFSNLTQGQYTIVEDKVAGWNQTFPHEINYTINLIDKNATNYNFGNHFGPINFVQSPYPIISLSELLEMNQEERKLPAASPRTFNLEPSEEMKLSKSLSSSKVFNLSPSYPSSFSLLSHVPNTVDRFQGVCNNCWVWASTSAVEIAHDVNYNILDRLSVQYFNSNFNSGTGDWACCYGNPQKFANWYNTYRGPTSSQEGLFIPWTNAGANFRDSGMSCSGSTSQPGGNIGDNPNYLICSIGAKRVETYNQGQAEAIQNIKDNLTQNKGVIFRFGWPNRSCWDQFKEFWEQGTVNGVATDVFDFGIFNGQPVQNVGGHLVLCVGYDDSSNSWIMLNSWDDSVSPPSAHPEGTFRVKMDMDYDMEIAGDQALWFTVIDVKFGGPDNFGYSVKDSKAPNGPTYDWEEISGTGTEILPNSDDEYESAVSLGFFFNFYGTDYSQVAVSNNGLLFSGEGSSQWVNEPIKESDNVHGFIAPFWDDIVTWGSAGSVYHETIGTAPNRKFIVEWKDNQHYSSSPEGVTFEAILYEGNNSIKFQYLDTTFGNANYDNGGSATVGIESPDGDDGLQYSFNEQSITPGLAILYKFPQTEGINLYISKQAPLSKDRGSSMTYTMHYKNFGDTGTQNDVELMDILPAEVEYLSCSDNGNYDEGTRKVTWNLGRVEANGRGYRTVTVSIPQNVAIGTVIQNTASIGTTYPDLEVRYDDNGMHAQTTVTGSNLPPNVGVEPNLGGTTPSVYWGTPITFSYYHSTATGVDINIHLDDGGPDITGSMINGPPDWTYTTTFYPRHGHATVTYTVHGGSTVTFEIYIDPAGYVYDINTNERIEGATVWLQSPDGAGGWENVPTGQVPPIMQPDENPLVTGVDGQYQWDVLEGSYRVHVEAPGYNPTDSIVVSIPPPVTDLHIGLTPLEGINTPPDTPSIPVGQTSCLTGSSYDYTTSARDPDGDQVQITIDWGDGTTLTSDPVNSEAIATLSHIWNAAGTYQVKAMANDSNGASSDWSEALMVTINTPPDTPSVPTGPVSGYAWAPYSYQTSATDSDGDPVQLTIDWGDGTNSTTGLVNSATSASLTHTWTAAGTYQIKAMSTDSKGATSTWSASLAVTIAPNERPNAPSKPVGPTSGDVGASYPFLTSATDPNGEMVKYTYDWGDGTNYTTPLVNSGTTASISHSWTKAGTYLIRIMATDIHGAPSAWSAVLEIHIGASIVADKIGVFRNGPWYLDQNGNRIWDPDSGDLSFWFGTSGDQPIAGDWNGDGHDEIGVFRNGPWYLDYNGNRIWDPDSGDLSFWFGTSGDQPIAGDWNSDGHDEIGVFRNGPWYLDYNGNRLWDPDSGDLSFWFGTSGDQPIAGDWNSDGHDEIGVFRNGPWYLDYNGNRLWDPDSGDLSFWFGTSGDTPVSGRWGTSLSAFAEDGFQTGQAPAQQRYGFEDNSSSSLAQTTKRISERKAALETVKQELGDQIHEIRASHEYFDRSAELE